MHARENKREPPGRIRHHPEPPAAPAHRARRVRDGPGTGRLAPVPGPSRVSQPAWAAGTASPARASAAAIPPTREPP
ncbi:hypothetical protein GCM10009759_75890 [Kitasatospora saccharophila]|uniref:Uncharacterized protein n=1 Tax=Kitasatospora saccharophila TaxID=407973 RepID=A0ABP5K1K2_9ACTN